MAISTQFPQIATAARPSALQSLALQAGQIVEAQIIGPAPNGGTQVQIAGQTLNLILPTLLAAGTSVKFEVHGSGAQMKLALQPNNSAVGTTSTASTMQPTDAPIPRPLPATTSNASNFAPSSPAPQLQPTPPTSTAGLQSATHSGAVSGAPLAAASHSVRSALALPASAPPTNSQATIVSATPPLSPSPRASVGASAIPYQPATSLAPGTPPQSRGADQRLAEPPISPQPKSAAANSSISSQSAVSPPVRAGGSAIPAGTPQAALAQMVQSAVPRQDSIGTLMTVLAAVAGKLPFPQPVARAMQKVLAAQLPLNVKLDGPTLAKAVLSSGVFQEANLAHGQTSAAPPDQKSALLTLQQSLANWLGPHPSVEKAAQIAPPMRGQVPRTSSAEPALIDPQAAPEEIGKHLLERTEASLSRLRLHQSASLPDPVAKGTADWSMDLPVLVGSQQSVLHLQIHRDSEEPNSAPRERGWQMRFAINVPKLGEVGAQVSLRGGATAVMLWATERQTSDALEANISALRQTLGEIGLRPGSVIVRHGEPPAPPVPSSGHFLDART